jgi:hypothetical protein
MRWLALPLVLSLSSAVAAADLPLPKAAETEHVIVHTDLGEAWAKATGKAIEAERARMVAGLGKLLRPREKPRRLTLLAFRSSAAYRRHAAKASPAHVRELGWYDPARARAVVHTDTAFPPLHEAAHWVLREVLTLPGRDDLPVWVVEGLPCLEESGGAARPGGYRLYRYGALAKRGLDPVLGLTAVASELGRGDDDALYAAGWAVALFLREKRPEVFRAYLAGIGAEGPLPDLVRLAGEEPEAIEKALGAFVAGLGTVSRAEASRRFPALIPDKARPVSEAEVHRQVEFLRHPDEAVRKSGLAWLADPSHEHECIAAAVLAAMPEEDDRFRMDACRVLSAHAPRRAIPWLIDLLESKDGPIRKRAIATLELLTRQRLGFKPWDDEADRAKAVARWRAWHAEHAPR